MTTQIAIDVHADTWPDVRKALRQIIDALEEPRHGDISIQHGAPDYGWSVYGAADTPPPRSDRDE